MLHIEEVKPENRQILYNFMQKYLYEMSLYYGGTMNAEGNFDYPYLPYYFGEETRKAVFICDDGEIIGFCLINNHSFTGEKIDNCIAEFTIFPAYRQRGYGLQTVELLLKSRPGSWQLKYSSRNTPGQSFWQKVRDIYNGTETPLEGDETALTIKRDRYLTNK